MIREEKWEYIGNLEVGEYCHFLYPSQLLHPDSTEEVYQIVKVVGHSPDRKRVKILYIADGDHEVVPYTSMVARGCWRLLADYENTRLAEERRNANRDVCQS